MPIYKYKGKLPQIGKNCFLAESADLVGSITIGDESNIWFNVVARADINEIKIGNNVNVQDLSMLHVTEAFSLVIGNNVTIGHNVVLHACKIGDNSLIGMGAIILDGAEIGKNCVVAAGSVVPPGKKYPENSMILGNPAKVKRNLSLEEIEKYGNHYLSYIDEKNTYLTEVEKI